MANTLKTEAQAKGDTILKEGLPGEYKFLDETMRPFCPEMTKAVVEHAYGTIWARGELSRRMRSITTLVCLATLGGCDSQIKSHLGAALRHGCTVEELREIFLHMHIYVGVPRAINALNMLRDVVTQMGGDRDLKDFDQDPLAFVPGEERTE